MRERVGAARPAGQRVDEWGRPAFELKPPAPVPARPEVITLRSIGRMMANASGFIALGCTKRLACGWWSLSFPAAEAGASTNCADAPATTTLSWR
jgi:hypothetical protein